MPSLRPRCRHRCGVLARRGIEQLEHVAVLTESSCGDDDRVGRRRFTARNDTVREQSLDSVAERHIDRPGAHRAFEHLRDLGTATRRLVPARNRFHPRSLQALDREVDAQRHQPFERGTRFVAEPAHERRIDPPLVDLHVVVEHRVGRVVEDPRGSLHARTRGEEPPARQRGRSTELRVGLEQQDARATVVRGDRGRHARRACADDDDVVVRHSSDHSAPSAGERRRRRAPIGTRMQRSRRAST